MKRLIIAIAAALFISTNLVAQKTSYNLDKGVIVDGYDVTEYFNNKAVKGSKSFSTENDGVTYYFASKENMEKFKASPEKFIPEYGGWCAYAVGAKKHEIWN